MAMLSKAKAAAKPEAEETPADEAAESPEKRAQEESEGTEMHSAPDDESAEGAPDDESAEGEAPDDESAEGEAPDDESAEGEEGGLSQTQLQEYQRASQLLHTILYQNKDTGRAVLAQIQDQDKVGSVARASVLIIQQIDKRLNLSDPIIPLVIITVVDRLLELADRVKQLKFSPRESTAVISAVTNGVKALYNSQPQQGAPAQGAIAPGQGAPSQPGQSAAPPQSQGGPTPAGPGLPATPQAGSAPNPGGEEGE